MFLILNNTTANKIILTVKEKQKWMLKKEKLLSFSKVHKELHDGQKY